MDRKGRNEGRRLGFWLEQSPVVLFFEKDSDLRSRSWKWRGPLCTWAFWEPYGTFKCRGGVVVPYRTQCITLPWVTLWLGYSFTLPRWPNSVASLENAGADWGAACVIWKMVGQTGFRGKEEPSILDIWKGGHALGWRKIQESWILASALQPCRSAFPF